MIEINLLPGTGKKKPGRGGGGGGAKSVNIKAIFAGLSEKIKDPWLIAAVVSVIIAAVSVGGIYLYQESRSSDLLSREEKALQDSTTFSAVLRDKAKAEAKRDTLLRQLNIVKSIDDDRFIWPHIMDEVSRVLPPYTWITVMAYGGTPAGSINVVAPPPPPKANAADKDKPKPRLATTIPRDDITVRITGRTVDIMALTRFMSDLENSPFIASVFMENTTPSPDQGKDAYMFQLTVKYARPDSMLVQRLPLASTIR
jgi:Tfp pilus assembly protein PilN